VDPDADPVRDARAIVAELKKFSKELASKPRWLVLNKRDLLPDDEAEKRARAIVRSLRFRGPHFLVSGATGRGTKELMEAVMAFLEEQAREERDRASLEADTDASPRAST
jgi:GTP-binding protein